MDCFGIIDFAQEKCVLFVPKLDNFYKIWMTTLSIDEWKVRYPLIDEIHYTDEMEAYFAERKPATIFLNKGVNSDSGLTTQYPEEKHYAGANAKIDTSLMHNILCESRVLKNEEELEVMRWASKITCEAHCNVLRNVKPGMRESQIESFFVYDCQ